MGMAAHGIILNATFWGRIFRARSKVVMKLENTPFRKALLSLALITLLPGKGLLAEEAPKNAAAAPAEAAASPLVWLTSLAPALEEAKRRDTYILVDLYAEWCGWCKQLEKKVFQSPEFARRARELVLLRVDTEDGADGSRLQALHDASSLPNTLLLDAKGVRVGQIGGYAPTREFLAYIDQQLAAWKELVANYPELLASDEAEIQLDLAKELHRRQDGERAAALYQAAAKRREADASSYAGLLYNLADAQRIGRNFELAEQTIAKARTLLAKADEPAVFGEQLDLLHYYIAQDNGDCRGARATLEQFLEAHPASQMRQRLQKTLSELRLDSKCT